MRRKGVRVASHRGLLVQGAVEAVNLLLAVLPDGVQGGPSTHHLQHVAVGSKGARGLASLFGVPHHLPPLHTLPSASRPLPSAAGLATAYLP